MSIDFALQQIDRLAHRLPLGFPSGHGGPEQRYAAVDNVDWTPGFWAGLLWLAYRHTGAAIWRERAEALLPSFALRLAAGGAGTATHDLGFLYTLSCRAAWQLTGAAGERQLALDAAQLLAARQTGPSGAIQAWGELDDPAQRGRILIDSTMNMPLLFWAARVSRQHHLQTLAVQHLDHCLRWLIRPDGSSFHTCTVDGASGRGSHGHTLQGQADGSCWARGQAWGLYGFALAHRHTQAPRFLDAASRMAQHFMARLPADGVCGWDLDLDPAADPQRDTSAAAIAACGLLELAAQRGSQDTWGARCHTAAVQIVQGLSTRYLCRSESADGILRSAVCHMPLQQGIDTCCLWGDYFYFEALLRLQGDEHPFW